MIFGYLEFFPSFENNIIILVVELYMCITHAESLLKKIHYFCIENDISG